MSKKKIITGVLAVLSAAFIATSCGETNNDDKGSASDNPTSSAKEEVSSAEQSSSADTTAFDEQVKALGNLKELECEITFWHTMGKSLQNQLDTFISAFNKIYPNITITHSQQGGYDDVKTNVSKAIPAGTTPTMTYCYPDHVADYLPSDSVVKLDNYINSKVIGLGVDNGLGDGDVSDFIPTYLSEGNQYTVAGKAVDGYYSMPYSKSTEVLFYNKDAFELYGWEVPQTWDQMWALCKTIKDTLPDCTPLGYDSDANFFITYCAQNDIPYTTGVGDNHFLFNNAEAKAFVNTIKDYSCIEGGKGYWTSQTQLGSGTYTSTKFTNEEVLMSIGSTGGTTYNKSDNFETGVAALPQSDLNDGKVIMQGPSICFMSDSNLKQRVAAWLFYKFITNTTNSAIWSSKTGYNPVRTSSFSDDNYAQSSYDIVNKVLQFTGTGSNYSDWYYTSPSFKGSSAARTEITNLMSGVLTGTKTVDKAFEDAYTNCLYAA